MVGFGQGYGDKYQDNIRFVNKTKLATFYDGDYNIIKEISFAKESPIRDAKIVANITNGYLLITYYKLTSGAQGESYMDIYDNTGKKLKSMPKREEWTYLDPHVTKDLKLLQFTKSKGEIGDYNIIYDLSNDRILEERMSIGDAVTFIENAVVVNYRNNELEDERVFYFSSFIFKKYIHSPQDFFEINETHIKLIKSGNVINFKELENYVVKK
jgi:hypothetical protein